MARNRCTFEKRAKEIARKQKQDEKLKRRQNKMLSKTEDEISVDEEIEPGINPIDETPCEQEDFSEQAARSKDQE